MKSFRLVVAFAVAAFAAAALPADEAKKDVPADKAAKCCAKAAAEGKACAHSCCAEAAAAGKNCEKCGGVGKAEKPADKK